MKYEFYKKLVRPIFFKMAPEYAHNIIKSALSHPIIFRLLSPFFTFDETSLEVRMETDHGTLTFPNPLILAAGFDKDGELYESLQYLGFGGITVGTATIEPRTGNKKPRLLRRIEDEAVVNAMGLPGKGVEYVAERLKRVSTEKRRCPIIVSIGGNSIGDYLGCLEAVEPYSDAIEVNVSCPNTEYGRLFEDDPNLCYELVKTLRGKTEKPLILKISPIKEGDRKLEVLDRSIEAGIDAVCATNTLKVKDDGLSVGAGGLSGKPLFEYALETVRKIYEHTEGKIPIIGTGGVFDSEDVYKMMDAGADAVGIYTGMIYRGPRIVRSILKNKK